MVATSLCLNYLVIWGIIDSSFNLIVKSKDMAICEITGKGKMYGHNVSFSQHKTRKVFKPNIQKRTFMVDGRKVKLNVSTSALRTLRKKGLIK